MNPFISGGRHLTLGGRAHDYKHTVAIHCKNIWVTSTVCWLSQLHACRVCDALQTSREATNLILNQSVVEKLLPLN